LETHVRNVGLILFYMGIGMGVLAIAVLVLNGGFSGLMLTNDPFYKRKDIASIPLARLLAVVYVIYSLIMAIPLSFMGRAILQWKPWAKTAGMLLASVNMLYFPIGTAAGLYALWVLNDEATEFLFDQAPAGGAKR
jgi:hypothetical protein